jgi:cell division protein FtsB
MNQKFIKRDFQEKEKMHMKKQWKMSALFLMLVLLVGLCIPVSAASKTAKKVGTTKLTVKKASATTVKFTWKKVSGAKGYVIYRATKKNGTYKAIKTVTSGKTVSYTAKNMDTGLTYYYKIRAYKTVKKKRSYGKYSTAVKFTLPLNLVGKWYLGETNDIPITLYKNGKIVAEYYGTKQDGTYKVKGNVMTLKLNSTGETATVKILRKGAAYYVEQVNIPQRYQFILGNPEEPTILRKK